MSLPDTAEVLIVGGGPTGLVLALSLYKNGCSNVVVVDGALQGENTSRAVAVHAATIEALDSVGCADLLVNAGNKVNKTAIFVDKGQPPIETAFFTPLSKYTKYPYILAVPQHITEEVVGKVAEERGIKVYRPHKVTDLKPNLQDNSLTDVTFEDGHVLRTRCVVGADGARSTVRRLANVGWADPSGEADANAKDSDLLSNMIIADVTLSACPAGFDADAISLVGTTDNAMLFIHLPGTPYPGLTSETVYRVACGIPPELGIPPHAPDVPYVQNIVDKWGPKVMLPDDAPHMEVKQVVWSSRFRTHSSIADTFYTRVPSESAPSEGGPVFLVGDAAHIHPPMGGQGMNLGIRDAVKLGPVLAEYVRATAAGSSAAKEEVEAPIRTWAAERRERALGIIAMVKGLQEALWVPNKRKYALGLIPYNPGWVRNTVLRFLTSFEGFKANNAWKVSGLGNP